MFSTLVVSVLVYAMVMFFISALHIPEPGPRVANVVVSVIFAVHLLNTFGVFHFLDR